MKKYTDNQLSVMIIQALNGTIDPEQFKELDELLVTDDHVLDLYVSILGNHAILNQRERDSFHEPDAQYILEEVVSKDLQDAQKRHQKQEQLQKEKIKSDAQAQLDAYMKKQPSQMNESTHYIQNERPSLSKFKLNNKHLLSMVACFLIGLSIWIFMMVNKSQPIAKITNLYRVVWSQPKPSIQTGSILLDSQLLDLQAGFVEIEFDDGAKVILEGPSGILLESANGAYLKHGKLSASVPVNAIGFSVQTPSATIVDLGTEFNVKVNMDGSSDVYVTQGSVSLKTKNDEMVVLDKGGAKTISSDGLHVSDISHIEERFVFDVSVLNSLSETSCDYYQTLASTYPDNHYSFEQDHDNIDYIGQAENFPFDLAICLDDSKKALSLNGKKSYAVIQNDWGDRVFKSGTLMFWFKFPKNVDSDSYPYGRDILSISSKQGPQHYASLLTLDYHLKLLTEFHADDLNGHTQLKPDTWYFIAITTKNNVQNNTSEMQLYLNGQLEEKWSDDQSIFEWDKVYLGVDCEKLSLSSPPTFQGSLDELTLYQRALSPDEINVIYRSAVSLNK